MLNYPFLVIPLHHDSRLIAKFIRNRLVKSSLVFVLVEGDTCIALKSFIYPSTPF